MIFRLIFTYRDQKSLSLVTGQFNSFDEVESYLFLGPEGDAEVIQTSDGGVLVPVTEIEELVIQQLTDEGKVEMVEELDFAPGQSLPKRVKIIKNPGTPEATSRVVERGSYPQDAMGQEVPPGNPGYISGTLTSSEEVTSESQTDSTTDLPVTETPVVNPPEPEWLPVKNKVEEKMGDEEVGSEVTTGTVPEKFVSFREKFLDAEQRNDSWEAQVIEKMYRREAKLKEFAGVLDKENEELEKFKQEKLGSV